MDGIRLYNSRLIYSSSRETDWADRRAFIAPPSRSSSQCRRHSSSRGFPQQVLYRNNATVARPMPFQGPRSWPARGSLLLRAVHAGSVSGPSIQSSKVQRCVCPFFVFMRSRRGSRTMCSDLYRIDSVRCSTLCNAACTSTRIMTEWPRIYMDVAVDPLPAGRVPSFFRVRRL